VNSFLLVDANLNTILNWHRVMEKTVKKYSRKPFVHSFTTYKNGCLVNSQIELPSKVWYLYRTVLKGKAQIPTYGDLFENLNAQMNLFDVCLSSEVIVGTSKQHVMGILMNFGRTTCTRTFIEKTPSRLLESTSIFVLTTLKHAKARSIST
jgi:hypothetical protein